MNYVDLMIEDHAKQINRFINESIEAGIKKFISVEGSEREKALSLLVENLTKENVSQASQLLSAKLRFDEICEENFRLSRKLASLKGAFENAQI